ncbi:MAG TPA: DegT/DnrJ/EryC1/StrS family aminotransferase [Clostridiales bacterium]|nr:DegT/DnrJ/EryC1/StrS family aminotransferase [Clostridiales bacterium]
MYRIGDEEVRAVEKVIKSRQLFRFNEGNKEVASFEKELAEKIGTKYSLALTGGTGALISALVGIGAGPGDEIIVPAYTFMATALAVVAVGAIPVIAEVDDSLTINPDDVEKKISKYTKAIIPVHMLGLPCNMDRIKEIAEKHNLQIVEDCCQADGGSYKGRRLGSIGDAGAFSFNYFKIITAGEGGAVTTNDEYIYEKALIYHDGGTAFRPHAGGLKTPIFIGSQLRSNEIAGAILRVQLQRLDDILSDLRKVKKAFMSRLEGEKNIKFIRSNDIKGDCGSNVGFLLQSENAARKFAASEGVNSGVLIDSKKHVYFDWEPIMKKRGSHHPVLDPFKLLQNKDLNMNYSYDMCPNALDILSRTVIVGMSPDWSEADIEKKAEAYRKSAAAL